MIESPFFVENLKKLPKEVLGVSPIPAIEYHLSKSVPRGATVCVMFPKGILAEVLPKVALELNLKVLVVGGHPALRNALSRQGSLEVNENAPIDLFLTEPTAFGRDGAWVHPNESGALAGLEVLCVGSMMQWLSHTPRDCDLVKIKGVVSEKGVFSSIHFDEEVRATLPWRVS